MKTLQVFAILAVAAITAFVLLRPDSDSPSAPGIQDLPRGLSWQIETLANGTFRVFGHELVHGTLNDARASFGEGMKLGIVAIEGDGGASRAHCRFLERQGLLERDIENSNLVSDAVDEDPMQTLLGHSISYRIPVGSQTGRNVFTLQTLPACDLEERFTDTVCKIAGFSLHAGVATKAHEHKKLERICRYISRPAVSERRLSLTSNGKVG